MADTLGLEPNARKGRESSNLSSCTMWAIGLFEGEGTIFLHTMNKRGKLYKYPVLELKMTDKDVVEHFADVVGVGRIRKSKPGVLGTKLAWTWKAFNNDAIGLMKVFYEHLSARRQKQWHSVLEKLMPS